MQVPRSGGVGDQPWPRHPREATHSTDDVRSGGIVSSAVPAAHADFTARRCSSASSRTTSSVTVSLRWVHARARRRDGSLRPAHPIRMRVRSPKIPAQRAIYRRAPRPPLLCVFPETLTVFSPLSQVIDDERSATASSGSACGTTRNDTYPLFFTRRSSTFAFWAGNEFSIITWCLSAPPLPQDAPPRAH